MPLDARMPDAGALVRGVTSIPGPDGRRPQVPLVVADDGAVRVTAVAVMHGRAVPALAYRFDTADGSVVFSGDTAVNGDLIALAQGADILVHHVADLGYLERHGTGAAELERMAALHTDVSEVGGVAERARVSELILSHYLPAEPDAITRCGLGAARRAGLQRDDHRGPRRPAQNSPPPCLVIASPITRNTGPPPSAGDPGPKPGRQLRPPRPGHRFASLSQKRITRKPVPGGLPVTDLVSAGHRSRTLCSTVSMTSFHLPLSTCLAMLSVKPLAVAAGTWEGRESA